MATDKKISDLTSNPTITGLEEIPLEKGDQNYKNTFDDLKTYVLADVPASGVQSVNGSKVDNTDPENPIIDATTKTDVGLGNADNTSDANKPVSTANQTALDLKADKATLTQSGGNVTGSIDTDANTFTLTSSGGGGGAVDSVNSQTGVVVLDGDDIETTVGSGTTINQSLDLLAQGQTGGLISFTTLAILNAYTDLGNNDSYKVTNDVTPTNNGYYHWSGSVYVKDDSLTNGEIKQDDNNAVKGGLIYSETEFLSSITYGENMVNMLDTNFNPLKILNSAGGLSNSSFWNTTSFIKVEENTTYTPSYKRYTSFYDKNKDEISTDTTRTDLFFTTPLNTEYVRFDSPDAVIAMILGEFAVFPDGVEDFRYLIDKKEGAKQYVKNLDESVIDDIDISINTAVDSLVGTIDYLNNQVDTLSDKDSPFFIENTEFFKGFYSQTQTSVVGVIPTKTGTNTFTVSDSEAEKLSSLGQGLAVSGGNYDNYTVLVTGVSSNAGTTTYTVLEDLPSTLVTVQSIGQGGIGQHLSDLGQKAYAEYVSDQLTKYNYKKTVLVDYNASIGRSIGFSDPKVYNLDLSKVLFDFEEIGGSLAGGNVEGTTDLARFRGTTSDLGMISYLNIRPLTRAYLLRQGLAGQGVKLSSDFIGSSGFVKVYIGVDSIEYTPTGGGTANTNGNCVVKVLSDGVEIHNQVVTPLKYESISVDFSLSKNITIEIETETSVPTAIVLGSLQVFLKDPNQVPEPIIKDGDVVCVFGDSWGVFPLIDNGDPSPLRPDGSELGGRGYMSEHMKPYLESKGISIEAPNMSKGGQTSEWCKYWVNEIVKLDTKPTHCILHFSINDLNSSNSYTNNLDSVYDFDPDDQWNNKTVTDGGVFGSVNSFVWYDNMKYASDYLLAKGIKPIILIPPYTSSESQSLTLQKYFKSMMFSGFNDTYRVNQGEPNVPTV